MAFEKGHKLSIGRPVGSINKRSVAFYEAIQKEGFEIAKELVEIHRKAMKVYDNYGTIYEAIEDARIQKGVQAFPTEDKADKYLKIALDAAKEIAAYSIPKLKSVEHTTNNPLEGMTPDQRLEAMKQAVLLLEAQVKANGP